MYMYRYMAYMYMYNHIKFTIFCRTGPTGSSTDPRTTVQHNKSKHVLVVKMFAAITVCFFLTNIGLNLVFILALDDKWMYLTFVNNLCNPLIYYWLNKEFRKEYNDFWKKAWKNVRGKCSN